MSSPQRIEALEAEARYHRERWDLYRARVYSQRATTPARLRELELAFRNADARLRAARRAAAGPSP